MTLRDFTSLYSYKRPHRWLSLQQAHHSGGTDRRQWAPSPLRGKHLKVKTKATQRAASTATPVPHPIWQQVSHSVAEESEGTEAEGALHLTLPDVTKSDSHT